MPIIVSPDPAVTQLEGFVLDGLDLNDGLNFWALQLDGPPAPLRQRWIESDDSDGDVLAERSRRGNRTWTITLFVAPQASTDAFIAKIGQIQDKLYEAEQQAEQGGLEGTWTPAGGSNAGTLRVLSGEITGLPITVEDGWFARAPKIQLRLDCFPFLIGEEVTTAATVTNSNPYQILTVAGVTGDVPAEARLVVSDGASQSRRFLRWGRRWRYYDATASLYIDSDNMVTSGFTGTQTTRTGAHDPNAAGNNVVRSTLTTTPIALCGLGNLGHVGSYLPVLRCYAATTASTPPEDFKVRLSWKEGDGPLRSNGWVSPPIVNNFAEVELGNIAIPPKTLGTQRWTGQIEAYSADITDTLDVDYVLLYPTDGYGKARAPVPLQTPNVLLAQDEFNQTAGNLNGKTLPVGGTWATVGVDPDFTVETTGHTAERTTTIDAAGKVAVAGTATYTNVVVQVDAKATAGTPSQAVIARYVDVSNMLMGQILWSSGQIRLFSFVAGVLVAFQEKVMPLTYGTTYSLRMWAGDRGDANLVVFTGAEPTGWDLTFSHTSLATGGALATGKVGFRDANVGLAASTRNYDNFRSWAPTDDAVLFSGRSAEVNSQTAERADTTGTYFGPIRSRGAKFFLEPAGDENRTNEVVVSAKRNDIETQADGQIADSTTVTIHYTPRWSTVPR